MWKKIIFIALGVGLGFALFIIGYCKGRESRSVELTELRRSYADATRDRELTLRGYRDLNGRIDQISTGITAVYERSRERYQRVRNRLESNRSITERITGLADLAGYGNELAEQLLTVLREGGIGADKSIGEGNQEIKGPGEVPE